MNLQKQALLNALDIPIWISRLADKPVEKTYVKLKVIGKPFSDRAEMLFTAMLAVIHLKPSDVFFVHSDEGSTEQLQLSFEENVSILTTHHPDYLLRNRNKKAEAHQDLLQLQNLIDQSKLSI